ncbi:MAG: hypothetical protein FWD18_00425 [Micrococcales bacterium]|nr:hypothetical protein [Micrococcales bacterium]
MSARTNLTLGSAEAAVLDYLSPLVDVPVLRGAPAGERPEAFVRLMLTGTRRTSLVQADAQVTVECWAPTHAAAYEVCRQVYGLLGAMDLDDGTHVPPGEDGWAAGPYASVDPDTGTPGYVMTVVVRQPVEEL